MILKKIISLEWFVLNHHLKIINSIILKKIAKASMQE